jgi:hypothetical protein
VAAPYARACKNLGERPCSIYVRHFASHVGPDMSRRSFGSSVATGVCSAQHTRVTLAAEHRSCIEEVPAEHLIKVSANTPVATGTGQADAGAPAVAMHSEHWSS